MNAVITIRPGIDHELGDFADAADVLDAVGVGEAEILVEAVAHVVAVEQVRAHAERVQLALDDVRDRRLAAAGKAGHPQHARAMAVLARARILVDFESPASGCSASGAARNAACRRRPCGW